MTLISSKNKWLLSEWSKIYIIQPSWGIFSYKKEYFPRLRENKKNTFPPPKKDKIKTDKSP